MANVGGLNGFCGSHFWDWNVTWETTNPDFTPCFQQTVLVWIPVVFLAIFSPFEIYYCVRSRCRDVPLSWISVAKTVIAVVLVGVSLLDLAYAIYAGGKGFPVYMADVVAPIVNSIGLIWSLILVHYNRKCGMRTSGLLFLFWLLMSFCGAITYRSHIVTATSDDGVDPQLSVILAIVSFPLVVASLLLQCCADVPPKYSEASKLERPCPMSQTSYLSRITFSWFDGLAWKGFRRPLEPQHLWDLDPEDTAKETFPKFSEEWEAKMGSRRTLSGATYSAISDEAEVKKESISSHNFPSSKPVSVLPCLYGAFGATILFGIILKILGDLLVFVHPQIMSALIDFVEGDEHLWRGFFYAISLLLVMLIQSLTLAQSNQRLFLAGMRIRTALISAIYRKALVISNTARRQSTVGEIVNLMSVDVQRIMDVMPYVGFIFTVPIQIGLSIYFLWGTLGVASLAGLGTMVLLVPISGVFLSKIRRYQFQQMKSKDRRIKLMNEILSGIKVLKLYAWEPSFEAQVTAIRDSEVADLRRCAYMNAGVAFLWSCAPFLVSLVSFGTYVLSDPKHVLDAQTAFVSLTLFNIIRVPVNILPMIVVFFVQANVSLKRINKFMNMEDLDTSCVTHDQSEPDAVVVENGVFTWESNERPVLHNISFRAKPGSLVAVVGVVGAGKSSLISACLGEMDKISGRVNTKGSIAYVPQQAWIQNDTLRNNILFGKDYDFSTYDRILNTCALKPDIEMLPGGDKIEIGEKGINLSGGQKQRVSLARAVYSDVDIYFLDDPLSAVDSHVGKHIFENVIGPNGILKKKTRILVTHGITYLPHTDTIIVLKDGHVSESGTYRQLLERKGDFADFLVQHMTKAETDDVESENELEEIKLQLEKVIGAEELEQKLSRSKSYDSDHESDASGGDTRGSSTSKISKSSCETTELRRRKRDSTTSILAAPSLENVFGEKLIEAEKAETGSVKLLVYAQYVRALGVWYTASTLVLYLVYQTAAVGGNVWLSEWSNVPPSLNGTQDFAERDLYLGVYGGIGIVQAFSILGASIFLNLAMLRASALLHHQMLHRILCSPMSFFDTTPLGRIVNRFGKDVDCVDNTLPQNFQGMVKFIYSTLSVLVVISYTTPIFIVVIVPLAAFYYFLQRFYVATSRQLKRIESVARSPIYSHFEETVAGAAVIRAYGAQQKFIHDSEAKVDRNQICYFPSIFATLWIAVRLEAVGNLITFFSSLFAVLGKDTLNPGLVGLSINYALQTTALLNMMVKLTADVETNIVSVERIDEYGNVEQEASWDVPSERPDKDWPAEGRVQFRDYKVRYREGLDLVLRGISWEVKGREKVGIVGRTGAGKSSLTLALFRILEPASGTIVIDDVDVRRLGLHTLRSRLTIIPQDPVLFSGTLRNNLDPFERHSDEEIWSALELAHLKQFARGLEQGLAFEIAEGGDNMSVGQRQLVCLARALLRKTKVLILDEATAAVDLETDDLIQKTIRSEFSDCTVITIAHRLNTILDSDRVLVLEQGQIIEYDNPNTLLQNKNSMFYSMAKDADLI